MPDFSENEAQEREIIYAIRLTPRARGEVVEAVVSLAQQIGEASANAWYAGLRTAAGTLATFPRRYRSLPRESRLLGREVRHLLYRPTPHSSAAYHLYYYVSEAGGEDGPRVTIIHIRHAARRPLTPRETRDLRTEDGDV